MYNSFSHTKDNDFFDINLLKNIFLVYIWFWSRMISIIMGPQKRRERA